MSGVTTSSSRLYANRAVVVHWDEAIEKQQKHSPSSEEKSVELATPTLVGADPSPEDATSTTSLKIWSPSDASRCKANLQRSVSASDLPLTPKLPVTPAISRSFSYSPVNSENEGKRGSRIQKALSSLVSSVKSIVSRKSSASACTSTSQPASEHETLTKSTSLERPTPSRRSSSSESMEVADSASLASVPSSNGSFSSEGTVKSKHSRSFSIASFAQSILKPNKVVDDIKSNIDVLKSQLEFNKERLLELKEEIQEFGSDAEQRVKDFSGENKQFNLIVKEKVDGEAVRLKELANSYISDFLVNPEIEELKVNLEKENGKIKLPNFLKFLKVFRFLGIFHDEENASSLKLSIKNLIDEKESSLKAALNSFSERKGAISKFESDLSSFLETHGINFSSKSYSAEFINDDRKNELQKVLSDSDLRMRRNSKSNEERKKGLEEVFGKWIEEKKEAFKNDLIEKIITEKKAKLDEENVSRAKERITITMELAEQVNILRKFYPEVDAEKLISKELFRTIFPFLT